MQLPFLPTKYFFMSDHKCDIQIGLWCPNFCLQFRTNFVIDDLLCCSYRETTKELVYVIFTFSQSETATTKSTVKQHREMKMGHLGAIENVSRAIIFVKSSNFALHFFITSMVVMVNFCKWIDCILRWRFQKQVIKSTLKCKEVSIVWLKLSSGRCFLSKRAWWLQSWGFENKIFQVIILMDSTNHIVSCSPEGVWMLVDHSSGPMLRWSMGKCDRGAHTAVSTIGPLPTNSAKERARICGWDQERKEEWQEQESHTGQRGCPNDNTPQLMRI